MFAVRFRSLLDDDPAYTVRPDVNDLMPLAGFDHDQRIRLEGNDRPFDLECSAALQYQVVLMVVVVVQLLGLRNGCQQFSETNLYR